MKRLITAFCVLLATAGLLAAATADTDYERDCAKLATSKETAADRLHQLFTLHWEYTMRENPEFATEVGYPGQNDRWTDNSLDAIERRKRELQAPMKVIQSINRTKLNATDQLNYDLFKKDQAEAIA